MLTSARKTCRTRGTPGPVARRPGAAGPPASANWSPADPAGCARPTASPCPLPPAAPVPCIGLHSEPLPTGLHFMTADTVRPGSEECVRPLTSTSQQCVVVLITSWGPLRPASPAGCAAGRRSSPRSGQAASRAEAAASAAAAACRTARQRSAAPPGLAAGAAAACTLADAPLPDTQHCGHLTPKPRKAALPGTAWQMQPQFALLSGTHCHKLQQTTPRVIAWPSSTTRGKRLL